MMERRDTRYSRLSFSGDCRGAALIVVLAFVVLLALLTLAFFSRATAERGISSSSATQAKARLLAHGALDQIVGDLKQEIAAGSTVSYDSNGKNPIYAPKAPATVIPTLVGSTATSGLQNLIKRSAYNLPFYPSDPTNYDSNASNRAAQSTTTVASLNGRFISTARWNKPLLLTKQTPSSDTDLTPVTTFTAPDWILLARDGSNPTAWNSNMISSQANSTSVIGRYAYTIYDEGGLLDMNIASCPTATTTIQFGHKGSLAFADLTAIPGIASVSGISPALTTSEQNNLMNNLIGWRNFASAGAAGSMNTMDGTGYSIASSTSYYNFVATNPSGFLTTANTSLSGGQSDRMFTSRQELIKFLVQGIASPLSTSTAIAQRANMQYALQYLGTFSRELNQPSWRPDYNAVDRGAPNNGTGNIYAYKDNASATTSINRDFLTVRVTTPFPNPRFDGTTAIVGEPLVKTRFPLSRLAWITYKGPSASLASTDQVYLDLVNAGVSTATIQAGTTANIKACFGLTWGGTFGSPWTYTNPAGSGSASTIMTLDQVAAAGREPDFFELLQAGILSGSLGQSTAPPPGTAAGGVTGGNVFPDVHMSSTMQQLLTIGACIIDQASPESIPTNIQFTGKNGNTWTAYGVKNLPYITQIYPVGGKSPANQWATYLLFQLWDPHQNAPTTTPPVRMRLDGGLGTFRGGNGEVYNPKTDGFTSVQAGTSLILNSVASFAPSPAPVTTMNSAPSGPGNLIPLPTPPASTTTPFLGYHLLDFPAVPGPNPGQSPILMLQAGATSTNGANPFQATMEVDASDAHDWSLPVPYNRFIGINDPASWIKDVPIPVRVATSSAFSPRTFATAQLTQTPPPALMKSDPRSTRFGIVQVGLPNPAPNGPSVTQSLWPSGSTALPNGYGGTIADPGGPVEHAPNRFSTSGGGNGIYYPGTLCINDDQASSRRNTVTTSYADNDNVYRTGDSVYPQANTQTGSATPYAAQGTLALDYHPIVLNRPFRSVAELGYAFRDLPWKTLDFCTDRSADAGLLDIFCINDGPRSTIPYDNNGDLGTVAPPIVAGQVSLNTRQSVVLQSILAAALWNEPTSTFTVFKTGTAQQAAPVMATNILNATLTTPIRNRSEFVTRTPPVPAQFSSTEGLPVAILPAFFTQGQPDDQTVKAYRETVARAITSVTQTRTWDLMIDVIAQSGRYPPTATGLTNFFVEGEKRYWLHVAIDRFTGQVIDQQLEEVFE